MCMEKRLMTERLVLLPGNDKRDNIPFLEMLRGDGDFRIFCGVEPSEKNILAFENYFEKEGCCFYAIFSKEYPNKLIGYVGISRRGEERVEAEFYVSRAYRNQGYCAEALHKLCEEAFCGNLMWRNETGEEVRVDIDNLCATTISSNVAAVKVLEKCGFTRNSEIAWALLVFFDPDDEDIVYDNEIAEYILRKI